MVYLSIFILGRPFVYCTGWEMMNETVTDVKSAILRKIAVLKF